MADADLAELRELDTKAAIQRAGGMDYLKGKVEDHDLDVKTNKGGPRSRTLVQFKNDIIAALERRLNVAPRPASPVDVAQLTEQVEQINIQGGGAVGSNSGSGSGSDDESEAESDESETHSQVERREERELEEELAGPDPNGWFDYCDGRAHGLNESASEEEF